MSQELATVAKLFHLADKAVLYPRDVAKMPDLLKTVGLKPQDCTLSVILQANRMDREQMDQCRANVRLFNQLIVQAREEES